VRGAQQSTRLAREISGPALARVVRRQGLRTVSEGEPVSSIASAANSRKVLGLGA
jgi:hypothetical protein